jgi:N-acetylglucosaminyldiphosphoundecaprenol N-acetyl-beta-D-mannosaminyltransferase
VLESVGIELACRLKREPKTLRIPGIDLMIQICQKAEEKNWSVYLLGGKEGVAEKSKLVLQKQFPNLKIIGFYHGYFSQEEENQILNEIKNAQIIFVGMSMPLQEKWIRKYLSGMKGLCAMGVGGSFDVISGNVTRAPKWMQRTGLEWLYRLILEPWRWKRIMRLPLLFVRVFFRKETQSN